MNNGKKNIENENAGTTLNKESDNDDISSETGEDKLLQLNEKIKALQEALKIKNELIKTKTDKLTQKMELVNSLQETIVKKNKSIRELSETAKIRNELINQKSDDIAQKSLMINRLKSKVNEKKLLIQNKKIQLNRKNDIIKQLQETAQRKDRYISTFERLSPLIKGIEFSEFCRQIETEIKSDVYVSHDFLPLLAANILSSRNGGKIFCDVTENPDFRNRSAAFEWQDELFAIIQSYCFASLRNADLLMTVGPTLASRLSEFGPAVWILENFRYKQRLVRSNELRERCGNLGKQDFLVLSIGTIYDGFENVVHAFKLLPPNFHIATLSRFYPEKYGEMVTQLVHSLKLERRIHFFDLVPYDQLASTASSADFGIVVLNPEIVNHFISLPNRVFDYLSSNLPFCSPAIPDIANIINTHQVGSIVENLDPEGWATAILETAKNIEAFKQNSAALASKFTWDMQEPEILNRFAFAKDVTFLGMGDLTRNNRTKRIALTLAQAGINVKICSASKNVFGFQPEHSHISYFIQAD